MQSQYSQKFNHDDCAENYDREVCDETHPIRSGYQAVIDWVAQEASITADSIVLDLGAGTGNTSQTIKTVRKLICVDVSSKMMELAKTKLDHLANVQYVKADFFEYFIGIVPKFDVIISTYAIHHLTDAEKYLLFEKCYQHLQPGGRAVWGDLMFLNKVEKQNIIQDLLSRGREDVVADTADEFFWDVEVSIEQLAKLGFKTKFKQFSQLSWAIAAVKS